MQAAAKWNITFPVNAAATPSSPLMVTAAFVAQSGAQMTQLGSQQFRVAAAGAQCLVWEDFTFTPADGVQYFMTFQMSGCDGTALTLFADATAQSDSFTVDLATGSITQLPHALDATFAPAIDGWHCDLAEYSVDAQCCEFGEGEQTTYTACSKSFYCCQPLAQCVENQDMCTSVSSSVVPPPQSSSAAPPQSSSTEPPQSSSNLSPEPSSSTEPPQSSSNISPEPSSSAPPTTSSSDSSNTSPVPSSSALPTSSSSSTTPSSSSSSTAPEPSSSQSSHEPSSSPSSVPPASSSAESSESDEWPDKWIAGVAAVAAAVGLALVIFLIACICACRSKSSDSIPGDDYEDEFSY